MLFQWEIKLIIDDVVLLFNFSFFASSSLDLTASTRRLTWEATPHSIHDGVQAAIGVSDCLVFNSNTALLFADSGSLGINVTISKVRGSW